MLEKTVMCWQVPPRASPRLALTEKGASQKTSLQTQQRRVFVSLPQTCKLANKFFLRKFWIDQNSDTRCEEGSNTTYLWRWKIKRLGKCHQGLQHWNCGIESYAEKWHSYACCCESRGLRHPWIYFPPSSCPCKQQWIHQEPSIVSCGRSYSFRLNSFSASCSQYFA